VADLGGVAAAGPLSSDAVGRSAFDASEAAAGNGWMAAFLCEAKEQVHACYEAALASGGTDEGPPGERPWRPDYYGAYVRDPDGNKLHFVWNSPGLEA